MPYQKAHAKKPKPAKLPIGDERKKQAAEAIETCPSQLAAIINSNYTPAADSARRWLLLIPPMTPRKFNKF